MFQHRTESKIIEIAIIIHDGEKVIEKYESLVNPEKSIDWFVTKLTGIKNKDVEKAPKFFEIAKKIYQLIENRVFVAHNIGFDYPIVRNVTTLYLPFFKFAARRSMTYIYIDSKNSRAK